MLLSTPTAAMVRLTPQSTPKDKELVNASVIETSPIAEKAGMVFMGWYFNSNGTGDKIVFPFYPTGAVTLYAHYVSDPGDTVLVSSAQDLYDIRYNLKKTTSSQGI